MPLQVHWAHYGERLDAMETLIGCGRSMGEFDQKQLSVDSTNFVLLRIKMSAVLFYKTFHLEDFPEILSS